MDYTYAAHRRVWTCIDQITDAQFVQDFPYSLGSVRNHLVHLIGVDQRWLARMQQQPVPQSPENSTFSTRAAVRAYYDEVEAAVLAYVNGLDDATLAESVRFTLRGSEGHKPRWLIAVHMVNHGTDHRAQVLPLLHGFGAPTFEQDLMLHYWDKEQ
jgi:uncharacterized damage-inducible protein DinB